MGKRSDALLILREAEASIRELIETAAREKRYADVAELAEMAAGLSALLKSGPDDDPSVADTLPLHTRRP